MKWAFIAVIIALPFAAFAQTPLFDPIEKYANGGIVEVLIVPGHDDENPGAVFRGQREADMNLILAEKLAHELSGDEQLFVTVSRNRDGYYPPLEKYLDDNKREIESFIKNSKSATERFLENNGINIFSGVTHNNAPSDVAFGLYGINKWAAEESFDFIIHIHFNDDTSHYGNNIGRYGGYSIYVPDQNLLNADKARPFALSIGQEMKKTFFPSNLPAEVRSSDETGLIPDFKLIALGSNRTLETPSILVEYSYIYEPHVAAEFLDLSTSVMARATARGIFNVLSGPQSWRNLSHVWYTPLALSTKNNTDTLALQFALRELGYYPPKNLDRVTCTFSGFFGPCTQRAVKEFQKANGLEADGIAGPQTFEILNAVFGF